MRTFRILFSAVATLFISVSVAQNVKNLSGYVQVYDIESSLPLVKNKFTYENDSIRITYYFWGNNGIVQIGINNKLDKPIYIDWKNSFYKNAEHTLSYAPEIVINNENKSFYERYAFEGRFLHSIDYEMNYNSATSNEFATKVEDVTEIKPYGYYMRLKYHLVTKPIYTFTEDAKKLSEPSYDNAASFITVYEQTFDKATSPFVFSSNVVFSADKEFTSPSSVGSDFFVTSGYEMIAKHFRGERSGKDAEGRAIYKFPYRRSSRFYQEIDKKESLEYKTSRKK